MGITHSWNGTILTITSDSGTSSADLKGQKGDDGARGAQGARGLDGINGKDGKDANIDLTPYATIDYVEETVANIEHPTVDFTGYATEDYVDRAIEDLAIGEVDLSSYATKQYVDDAVANVDSTGGVELTQAEYDALTEEDKNKDIIYFVTDGTEEDKEVVYVGSNPNLLINGDFQVNQRGQSSYSGNTNYTVDRWRLYTTETSLLRRDDNKIEISSSAAWGGIYQLLENPSSYSGKTMTVSAKLSNSTGKIGVSLRYKRDNSVISIASQTIDGSEEAITIAATGNVPTLTDNDKLFVVIWSINPNTITVCHWIKLEQGKYATPFIPRLYAEELALCQRYYYNTGLLDAVGYCGSTGVVYLTIPQIMNMRDIRNVEYNFTTFNLGAYNAYKKCNITSIAKFGNTELAIFSDNSNVLNMPVIVGLSGTSKLILDAEIY